MIYIDIICICIGAWGILMIYQANLWHKRTLKLMDRIEKTNITVKELIKEAESIYNDEKD